MLQYTNQEEGGLPDFVTRARELAATGTHFETSASVVAMAAMADAESRSTRRVIRSDTLTNMTTRILLACGATA